MECKMGGEPGTVNMERNGNERNRERTGTGSIRKKRRHELNVNKLYRQQNGTEHIETSHQLDETRKRGNWKETGREGDVNGTKARRDGKGTDTVRGRERGRERRLDREKNGLEYRVSFASKHEPRAK